MGNVVLYNHTNYTEYYSTCAAVLENLMLSSPAHAVFLTFFKVINAIEMMRKELYTVLNDLETNISTSVPLQLDELLFFPALVTAKPHIDIKIENGLGWHLWCPNINEFLSTRFLHILLLYLAYFYCLPTRIKPDEVDITNPVLQELVHCCTVWTNGIYWKNRKNRKNRKNKFEVVVEVSEYNHCVTVLTSNEEMDESHKVFNSVIKKVLSLKKQFFSCTSHEYMIAPDQVSTACTLEICQCTFY